MLSLVSDLFGNLIRLVLFDCHEVGIAIIFAVVFSITHQYKLPITT